jgi:hypothetical protein
MPNRAARPQAARLAISRINQSTLFLLWLDSVSTHCAHKDWRIGVCAAIVVRESGAHQGRAAGPVCAPGGGGGGGPNTARQQRCRAIQPVNRSTRCLILFDYESLGNLSPCPSCPSKCHYASDWIGPVRSSSIGPVTCLRHCRHEAATTTRNSTQPRAVPPAAKRNTF